MTWLDLVALDLVVMDSYSTQKLQYELICAVRYMRQSDICREHSWRQLEAAAAATEAAATWVEETAVAATVTEALAATTTEAAAATTELAAAAVEAAAASTCWGLWTCSLSLPGTATVQDRSDRQAAWLLDLP